MLDRLPPDLEEGDAYTRDDFTGPELDRMAMLYRDAGATVTLGARDDGDLLDHLGFPVPRPGDGPAVSAAILATDAGRLLLGMRAAA
jgi:hypothetical protein